MKVKSMKGFTLAELLIVMAIVVVLASIAIPTFGKQLETARETNDADEIRAAVTDAFSVAYTKYVTGAWPAAEVGDSGTGHTETATITFKQQTKNFQYVTPSITVGGGSVELKGINAPFTAAQTVKFIFKEADDGEGGIQLDDIKISDTSVKTAIS